MSTDSTPAPAPKSRVIAIVGRPNVGKSALFNRIAGQRLAIVHEQEGVTRDRLAAEARWFDERFQLIDTGGIGYIDNDTPHGDIEQGMQRQVNAAIEDAAVLILAVDVMAGLHPLDHEVASRIRATGLPVIVAATKADNDDLARNAADFARLGLPVFPVSSLHNRGIAELVAAAMKPLPPFVETTRAEPLRVAVCGRPNAGKSSFINRLIGRERVIVSDVPGTTRDSVEVPFVIGSGPAARHYLLIDTAGLKKKVKARSAVEKFSIMRMDTSIERSDVVVLIIDASEGPTVLDKKIAQRIHENNKGCVVLVNKWDLAGESEEEVTQRKYTEALLRHMPFFEHCPVLYGSAKTGFNMRKVIEVIDQVAAETAREFTTGVLNRLVQDAVAKRSPPSIQGKRLKILYLTQAGTRPIRFKFFVNNADLMPPAYERYLMNQLRAKFGLSGAPVVFHYVGRKQRDGRADAPDPGDAVVRTRGRTTPVLKDGVEDWQVQMKADQARSAPRRTQPFGDIEPEPRRNPRRRSTVRAKKNVPVASRRKKKHETQRLARRGAGRKAR
ncbi:MAG: ribosome biogenesis GTPase Der [Kiritimatiellia bacterium]